MLTNIARVCVLIIVDGLQPIYEDMMYMLKDMLENNGHQCEYLYFHLAVERGLLRNDQEVQCFFMGTKLRHHGVIIPPGSYLMDFDHGHWLEERFHRDIVRSNHIVTYSSHMIQDFRTRFGDDIRISLFRFGYSKYLDYGYVEAPEYEYDICFLGTISERRKNIIKPLQERYKCFVHSHVQKYEAEDYATFHLGHIYREASRADVYKRSKIVLSIGFTEKYLQNTNASRIFPAVCTGAFVVAERSFDQEQNTFVDQICINVPLEELYDRIDYYLHHDDVRETQRKAFYNNVKSMQCSFLS